MYVSLKYVQKWSLCTLSFNPSDTNLRQYVSSIALISISITFWDLKSMGSGCVSMSNQSKAKLYFVYLIQFNWTGPSFLKAASFFYNYTLRKLIIPWWENWKYFYETFQTSYAIYKAG